LIRSFGKILLIAILLFSCDNPGPSVTDSEVEALEFISAVDISTYPEILQSNPVFYNFDGNQDEFLDILQANGVNTIRLRLWVNPINEHSGLAEVKQFSGILKTKGFKIWLTLHYSDTWADPGHQEMPVKWQGIGFSALKDSVYQYTEKVLQAVTPDFIQIGNEINSGLLHPMGNIGQNYQNFIELMNAGISSVRDNSSDTQIIIHFAGIENADWFFNQVDTLDYDIIGLSYYPIWHGKSLNNLKTQMQQLSETHHKQVIIAETAYPFTLEWNDWTNNIVGMADQLILPDYPASNEGQRQFIEEIITLTKEVENGIGVCYWGAELIAWRGTEATDGSPWENQALFDFQNCALPVLMEFQNENENEME